jgi:hypothetical protein
MFSSQYYDRQEEFDATRNSALDSLLKVNPCDIQDKGRNSAINFNQDLGLKRKMINNSYVSLINPKTS